MFDMPDIVELFLVGTGPQGWNRHSAVYLSRRGTYIGRAEILTDVLTKIPDFWGMSIGIGAQMILRSLLSPSTG